MQKSKAWHEESYLILQIAVQWFFYWRGCIAFRIYCNRDSHLLDIDNSATASLEKVIHQLLYNNFLRSCPLAAYMPFSERFSFSFTYVNIYYFYFA